MSAERHEIIVGNVGTVYSGTDKKEARRVYDEYVEQSQGNYGRAAGESVTWMREDELFLEHRGTVEDG